MGNIRITALVAVGMVLLMAVQTPGGHGMVKLVSAQQAPRVIAPIPGIIMLPPHGVGVFGDSGPTTPSGGPSPAGFRAIEVRSESDQPTTVSFTGSTLTIAAPAGSLVQFLSGCTGALHNPSSCPASAPATVTCIQGYVQVTCVVTFTTVLADTGVQTQAETVALTGGCANVALTWTDGTPLATVAAAISPQPALIAIWRFDAAAGHFRGWSPLPDAPNDLTSVNRLDAVFLCLREPGALSRPAL